MPRESSFVIVQYKEVSYATILSSKNSGYKNNISPYWIIQECQHQSDCNQKVARQWIVEPNLYSAQSYSNSVCKPAGLVVRYKKQGDDA